MTKINIFSTWCHIKRVYQIGDNYDNRARQLKRKWAITDEIVVLKKRNRGIKLTESNRIEYKRELNKDFEKSVISFLNYPGGGDIYIGIDDKGEAFGVKNANSLQCEIASRIRDNIAPNTIGLIDIVLEKKQDKDILRVIVSCGPMRPYYLKKYGRIEKGCFIRVGSTSQPMSDDFIDKMLTSRRSMSLKNVSSPKRNLEHSQLKIYYQSKKFEIHEKFLDNLEMYQDDGTFNFVAYLLADDNGVSIKTAVYGGEDKYNVLETREYGYICLLTATQRILDRLSSENRTFVKISSPTRIERERINTIAMREALINAIVHNDYTKGVPLVEIFSNRIVITSCGGLVDGLSIDDFFNCRSMPRNRELMRVFKDIEFVEQIGSGMNKILKVYDKSIFSLEENFTVVTFMFDDSSVEEPVADKKSEIQVKILNLIKENSRITVNELANITNINRRTVLRILQELQNKGLLKREGTNRNGLWITNY